MPIGGTAGPTRKVPVVPDAVVVPGRSRPVGGMKLASDQGPMALGVMTHGNGAVRSAAPITVAQENAGGLDATASSFFMCAPLVVSSLRLCEVSDDRADAGSTPRSRRMDVLVVRIRVPSVLVPDAQ